MNFAKMIAKIDSIESASAVGEGKGDDIADKVAKKKEERDDPFSSSYKDKDEKSSGVTRVKGTSYGNQDSEDGHKSDDDSDQDEDGKKKKKKKSKLEEADECTCTDDKEDTDCPVHGDHVEEAIHTGAALKKYQDNRFAPQNEPAKKELDEFDIDTLNQLASHPMAGTLAAAGGAAIGATIGKGITKAADWYKNRQEKKAWDNPNFPKTNEGGEKEEEVEESGSVVNPVMIPAIKRKSNARGGNFPLGLDQVRSGEIGQIQKLAGIGNNNFNGLKPVTMPKGPAGPRGLNESFDQAMAEEQVDEVTAPGQEGWVKANKERFIKQYGEEKGLKTLYSTAWKRHHAANESKNLEECYDQAMMAQPEETGMNINSSMDTKTGSKSLTVSAQGQAAEELAQILKLSGLLDGGASHEMEPEVVDIELDEYANEPYPITQSAEVQFNSGNDMHRKKHSQTVGAPVAIGNLAEQQKLAEIERRLMAQLNELKVVSKKAKPDFLDLNKNGNTDEPMTSAAADKKAGPQQGVAEGVSNIKQKIIKLYNQGLSDDEIAEQLGIDSYDVKSVLDDYEWVADTTGKEIRKIARESAILDEANTESKKEFVARQARLAAAGTETAKDPERLKRMMKIPGYAAAMGLAKKADTDVKKSK